MIKKFSQDPRIWINYANSLLGSKLNREVARTLLQCAMQAFPQDQHKDIISQFTKLKFRSGDPGENEHCVRTWSPLSNRPVKLRLFSRKWLGFEKSEGDEKSVENVTKMAKETCEAKKGE